MFRDYKLLLAGIAVLGVAIGFLFVPLLTEIIAAVQEKEGMGENPILNDKCTGLFNTFFGIGSILAPTCGGLITGAYGFRATCDVMAISAFVFAFIYLAAITIPACLEKKKNPDDEHANEFNKNPKLSAIMEDDTHEMEDSLITGMRLNKDGKPAGGVNNSDHGAVKY